MPRRINWPWRIVVVICSGPLATLATAAVLQLSHPELFGQAVTDSGQHVERVAPSPHAERRDTKVWCQSVSAPTTDPQLAKHLADLRQSPAYLERCTS